MSHGLLRTFLPGSGCGALYGAGLYSVFHQALELSSVVFHHVAHFLPQMRVWEALPGAPGKNLFVPEKETRTESSFLFSGYVHVGADTGTALLSYWQPEGVTRWGRRGNRRHPWGHLPGSHPCWGLATWDQNSPQLLLVWVKSTLTAVPTPSSYCSLPSSEEALQIPDPSPRRGDPERHENQSMLSTPLPASSSPSCLWKLPLKHQFTTDALSLCRAYWRGSKRFVWSITRKARQMTLTFPKKITECALPWHRACTRHSLIFPRILLQGKWLLSLAATCYYTFINMGMQNWLSFVMWDLPVWRACKYERLSE